jgi:hypothetical protein
VTEAANTHDTHQKPQLCSRSIATWQLRPVAGELRPAIAGQICPLPGVPKKSTATFVGQSLAYMVLPSIQRDAALHLAPGVTISAVTLEEATGRALRGRR